MSHLLPGATVQRSRMKVAIGDAEVFQFLDELEAGFRLDEVAALLEASLQG